MKESLRIEGVKPENIDLATVNQFRKRAVAAIAQRRGIYKTSVIDKYSRQLRPEIADSDEFDDAIVAWLRNGNPSVLLNALRKHGDNQDWKDIEAFFAIKSGGGFPLEDADVKGGRIPMLDPNRTCLRCQDHPQLQPYGVPDNRVPIYALERPGRPLDYGADVLAYICPQCHSVYLFGA